MFLYAKHWKGIKYDNTSMVQNGNVIYFSLQLKYYYVLEKNLGFEGEKDISKTREVSLYSIS